VAIFSQHPKRLAFIFVVLVTAALASYSAFWPSEPACQGRKLSVWLQELVALGLEGPPLESDPPARRAWEERHQSAVAAVQTIGPKALPYLLRWLRAAPKPSPLRDKLQALLEKQSLIKITLPYQSYHGEQAIAGFEALGAIATPALPQLKELLLDPTYSEVAAASLYAIGPAALPVLSSALTNKDYRVQYHALQSLVPLAPQVGPAAVPVLMNAITNPRCQYHSEALLGLGDLGLQAREATTRLEPIINDSSNPLRGAAMRVLAEVSENPKQYVPTFTERLYNTNFTKDAAFALARAGPEGVGPLLRALTNENRIIRTTSLGALRPEFRKPATVSRSRPAFSSLSRSFDSQYARSSSIVFISRPDLEAQSTGWRLAELLKNAGPEVRIHIVQLLGRYGSYSALGLSRALKDQDGQVRSEAKAAQIGRAHV